MERMLFRLKKLGPTRYPIKKTLGLDEDLVAAINMWRSEQLRSPTFQDALRDLIKLGLERRF